MYLGFQQLSKLFAFTSELISSEEMPCVSISNSERAKLKCNKKNVSFADVATIISVPNRRNLDSEITWWTSEDIKAFRADAFQEVHMFMLRNAIYDGRYAMQLMYQPQYATAPRSSTAFDLVLL